jgi:hypothetical protein
MFSGETAHPQGSGPYVLAQNADHTFVVQACHTPIDNQVSRNSAFAVKWGVGVDDKAYYQLPTSTSDGGWSKPPPCAQSADDKTCTFASGEAVGMDDKGRIYITLPFAYCDAVSGLCGNYDPGSNFADAFTTSSGTTTAAGERAVGHRLDFNADGGQPQVFGGPFHGQYQTEFVQSFAARYTTLTNQAQLASPDWVASYTAMNQDTLFPASVCPVVAQPDPGVPREAFADCAAGLRAQAEKLCPQQPAHRWQECLMDVGMTCDLAPWAADDDGAPVDYGKPTPAPVAPPSPAPCQYQTCDEMHECGAGTALTCGTSGDPHVRMFAPDTYASPQGTGPFVLAQSIDRNFVVQVRPAPPTQMVTAAGHGISLPGHSSLVVANNRH